MTEQQEIEAIKNPTVVAPAWLDDRPWRMTAAVCELKKIHKALVDVRELSAKFEELTGKVYSTGTAAEILACHLLGMLWAPTKGHDVWLAGVRL